MGGSETETDVQGDGHIDAPPRRDFRCSYTQNLAPILTQLGASLLISSYHVGELVSVGVGLEGLELSFHHFQRAMGIAVRENQLAVGTQTAIWFLPRDDELASRFQPAGRYDSCYLARSARFTGEILSHDLAWTGGGALGGQHAILVSLHVRRSAQLRAALATEVHHGAGGRGPLPPERAGLGRGWTEVRQRSGRDRRRGGVAAQQGDERLPDRPGQRGDGDRGLAMPHSPRIHEGRVWLLDSGRGRLVVADLARGAVETVAELPGYTRGLAMIGSLAFVGMSKPRKTNPDTGGVPIAGRDQPLKSGVAVVDLASGRQVALLEFQSSIEEVFDVQVLPGVRSPLILGPNPHIDSRAVWFVP